MTDPEAAQGVATKEPPGALFVVATPIGNLDDITARATHVLGIADLIACEDTRRTGRLLSAMGLSGKKLRRVDAHTERSAIEPIIAELAAGKRVALVSDAGTPAVSDPGRALVTACVDAGHRVVPIPGPSAVLAALVVSGLATDRFTVEGFLARKGRARAARLADIADTTATSIIYESPQRLAATLADLKAACGGDRRVVVARELTKLHEEIARGTIDELATHFAGGTKGEVVIVLDGYSGDAHELDDESLTAQLVVLAKQGHTRSRAASEVAGSTGASKRRVYELALAADWD